MKIKDKKECCSRMEEALKKKLVPLKYSPIGREYYFIYLGGPPSIFPLTYCVFCGKKLPQNLRETFFKILEKEYKIDQRSIYNNIKEDEKIPQEFKSDKWWKKRNL